MEWFYRESRLNAKPGVKTGCPGQTVRLIVPVGPHSEALIHIFFHPAGSSSSGVLHRLKRHFSGTASTEDNLAPMYKN